MTLSIKKSIFLLLFASFQVLIFFSLYTTYQFLVISLFLVFLLFYFWFFKLKITIDPKIGLLWFGLIVFLSLSSIYSHSFPLSLETLIFYTSSFCIFTFFRSLGSKNIFSKQELAATFLLVGFVLSMFFIVFFSFPDISIFLPSVNIFTTNHGHSHFTALLLFLIPLAWWFVTSNQHKSFTYKKPILLLFYTLLILTFGRFAIFLSLLQLPFIYKFVGKKIVNKTHLYLISSILVIFLIFGALISINSIEDCPTHEFRMQLCKQISHEVRPDYFKQAIRSFKAYPLFGYGPGTFSLITKKFNTMLQRSSIYAHNNFLQMFAESGLLAGTTYILLIWFLFKNMLFVLKRSKANIKLNSFLLLGLFSLLLNSFVDYDWELLSTFQATVILMALLLWDFPNKFLKNKRKLSVVGGIFIKYFWLFLTTSLIALGIINFIVKILIVGSNDSLAFKVFPYFYFQSNYFLEEENLPDQEMDLLYKIYRNHDVFILNNIEREEDIGRKSELYDKFMDVKLWGVTNTDYYQFLLDLGDYKSLGEASYKGLSLIIEIQENNGVRQSYESKEEIIKYLLLSADWHEKNGEYDMYNKYNDFLWTIWSEDWEN